jgi:hypothetical protein
MIIQTRDHETRGEGIKEARSGPMEMVSKLALVRAIVFRHWWGNGTVRRDGAFQGPKIVSIWIMDTNVKKRALYRAPVSFCHWTDIWTILLRRQNQGHRCHSRQYRGKTVKKERENDEMNEGQRTWRVPEITTSQHRPPKSFSDQQGQAQFHSTDWPQEDDASLNCARKAFCTLSTLIIYIIS